jgi:hypothetical protein
MRKLPIACLAAALIGIASAAPALAESTGCITANHGALDLSTNTAVIKFNYGGDFQGGETLRFATSSGTFSFALSRTKFGLPAEYFSWNGAGSTNYDITNDGAYSFHVTLTASPFQTATLAVTCAVPQPSGPVK